MVNPIIECKRTILDAKLQPPSIVLCISFECKRTILDAKLQQLNSATNTQP